MNPTTRGTIAAVLLALGATTAADAQRITVGPGTATLPTGASEISGAPIQLQGQTFVVPPGHPVLERFEFAVLNTGAVYAPVFEIFRWSGSTTIGPPLLTTTLPVIPTGMFEHALFAGDVRLRHGQTYIATLHTKADFGIWLTPASYPHYAGGEFRFFQSGAWHELSGDPDALFSATFSAVPEPASVVLVGAGLAGVALATRSRRRLGA